MTGRKLGDTITLDFTTHNPSTGAVSDADGLPTAEVFEDTTDTTVISLTVVKRTAKTGNYRVSIVATGANGFEVGKSYNVIASATVNAISAKSRIGSFTLDSKRNADLQDLSLSTVEGSTILAKEATLGTIAADVVLIRKIEKNKWAIVGTQFIVYDDDGSTPLLTYNLSGTQTSAFAQRVLVPWATS